MWNIATRFQRSQAKKAEEVAKVLKKTLEADGSSVDEMVGLMIDHAELAVARHLDKAKEGCYMHMPAKIVPEAYGTKDRTRKRAVE